jgi:hypothetical protein
MIDPIKQAYIAGFMAKAEWEDAEECEYWEKEAEKQYKWDVDPRFNWYGLADALDALEEALEKARLTIGACRGTQMDDAGIRQIQQMISEIVQLRKRNTYLENNKRFT